MFDQEFEAGIRSCRSIPAYFAAFLQAMQLRNANFHAMRQLDAPEWDKLLSLSDRMHLTLQLSQLPSDVLPGWVASRIQQNVSDNTRRVARIAAIYSEAAEALRRLRAEHLVIKGFAQYPGYVKSPNLRMQSDIDIFCPAHTILQARDALLGIGYQFTAPQKHVPVDHFPALIRETSWQWRGNAFDPEMPLGIELHYCLWNANAARFDIPEIEQFWYRRVERDLDGLRFTALDTVDHIAFCALHILRGLMRSEWIVHHVYEVAHFLNTHANDGALWERWRQTHSGTLRSRQAIAFSLAAAWFGCEVSDQVNQEIKALQPPIQRWFHCFAWSSLESMFAPNHDGVWLHVALVDSAAKKLRVLRQGLLPTRVPPLAIANPALAPTLDRTVAQQKHSWQIFRYASYVAARANFYRRVFSRGVCGGVGCWLAQKKIRGPFWKFFAASCFWSLGLSIFFFLFNLFLINHGFSEKLVGSFSGMLAAGSMIATLPTGRLIGRFGLRRVLLSGMTLAAFVLPLRVLLLSQPAQWALALLAGIALSVWGVCISPAIAQLTTAKNRPAGFSLIFSTGVGLVAVGNLIGGSLAAWLQRIPLLMAAMPTDRAALLIACAIAALGILPLCFLTFPEAPIAEKLSYTRSRFLIRFLPGVALWGLAIGAFMPFATIYFSRHLQVPLPRLGLVFSLAQIFQFFGLLCAPLLFRKRGRLAGITYAEISSAVALLWLAFVRQPAAACMLYIGYTTVQWMSEPGLYSMLMDNVPVEERSSASAWNALVLAASQALAAGCAGVALVRFGYAPVLSAAAGIAALSACSFWLLLRPQAQLTSPRETHAMPSTSVLS